MSRKIVKYITYIGLTAMAVLYLAPLVWMVFVSLKTNGELFSSPFALPKNPQWKNYSVAFTAGQLGRSTVNSLLVCSVSLICSIMFGAMAAFAFARMRWRFSELILNTILLGMMIPVHCILIPLFVIFVNINLDNNLIGLILPYISFSLPTTIFILKGFFSGMSRELFESACLDGCTIYGCFFKIALPLAKTGMFVTGLMTFVANWNELLVAMVFTSEAATKTLPVSLTGFVSPHQTNYVQMFAAIIIAIAPTVIVYCMFSNKIVDGLTEGAVKG